MIGDGFEKIMPGRLHGVRITDLNYFIDVNYPDILCNNLVGSVGVKCSKCRERMRFDVSLFLNPTNVDRTD